MATQRKKVFTANNKEYPVTFRKVKRAKVMRITITHGEGIMVTAPFFVPFIVLEKFWRSKEEWAMESLQALEALPAPKRTLTKERFLVLRPEAENLVSQKLEQWNRIYDFHWNRVTIRNQKTRFGSCSAKKNLSFHASIVELPESLQDYLIVHELCHLQEMNHGTRFWQLMRKGIDDPKRRARELAHWQAEV